MKNFLNSLREIRKYPSAIVGSVIILALVIAAVVVLITMPYKETIDFWRGGEASWYANPRYAPPKWFNWFRKDKLVESFTMKDTEESEEDGVVRVVEERDEGVKMITETFTFDYDYDTFPQDLAIYFTAKYDQKQPFVSLKWLTPDGREIKVASFAVSPKQTYRFIQDDKLQSKRLNGIVPNIGLFIDPEDPNQKVVKGTYQLVVEAVTFEADSNYTAEFVLYGQVYGWAGTDNLRRDLSIPLRWGIPIALTFGLLAALFTSVLTMIIAAIGAWYGGVVDALIQRITEVNMVLPFLSILIMVATFYSRSIWVILGVTILLSIFTGAIKGYRSIFLQVKESTYIEAAQAYGAGSGRLIFRYLLPRMIPMLLPALVSAVPAYVFLEATLAVLGIGDPVIPTWGKTINDAWVDAALYKGHYYWILQPAVLLMITGFGFAMLGFALDRIFNPRLRGM